MTLLIDICYNKESKTHLYYLLLLKEGVMERSDYIGKVGARIRKIRQHKGWSLQKLAELSDISEKNLGDIERGKGNPSLEVLEKVGDSFGMDVPALVDVEHDRSRGELIAELTALMERADDRELEQLFRVARALMF